MAEEDKLKLTLSSSSKATRWKVKDIWDLFFKLKDSSAQVSFE